MLCVGAWLKGTEAPLRAAAPSAHLQVSVRFFPKGDPTKESCRITLLKNMDFPTVCQHLAAKLAVQVCGPGNGEEGIGDASVPCAHSEHWEVWERFEGESRIKHDRPYDL